MASVPESDWKLFRKLQAGLVNAACEAVFVKVEALSKSRADCQHQAFLKLFKLVQDEDLMIAEMFNNPGRSNAILRIMALRRNGILNDEQFSQFSEETQKRIAALIE